MNPKPGEVWLVDLGLAAKTRPIIIVSRYDPHSISPIAYKSLDHAAKSIVNHFHKGEW